MIDLFQKPGFILASGIGGCLFGILLLSLWVFLLFVMQLLFGPFFGFIFAVIVGLSLSRGE